MSAFDTWTLCCNVIVSCAVLVTIWKGFKEFCEQDQDKFEALQKLKELNKKLKKK
jgi:hypothetical protein